MKKRLDIEMVTRGLARSRSQAESYIKLNKVTVNNKIISKPGFQTGADDIVQFAIGEQYVSRAGLKLASVAEKLKLDFQNKTVLDVGSSTGGFTDYALKHGAKKVIAVDVGSGQLHPGLRGHPRIELHEKTDIRDFKTNQAIDLVLADVSFISLREILPHVDSLVSSQARLVVMVKPQFEAGQNSLKHKGVIKNEKIRREIMRDFELWVRDRFVVIGKADSGVSGAKGNQERFYLLRKA